MPTIHNGDVEFEHGISVEIDDNKIHSIQDAINSFQQSELVTVNCINNQCPNELSRKQLRYKSIKFVETSDYLIVQLKRFKRLNTLSTFINKRIFLNDKILIKNNEIEKSYSLISVVHHLGDDINSAHYDCRSLINNVWCEINDDIVNTCIMEKNSTTCYINQTLTKNIVYNETFS